MRTTLVRFAIGALAMAFVSACSDKKEVVAPAKPDLAMLQPGPCLTILCTRPDPYVEITAGRSHTCVRAQSGKIYCWGRDEQGQAGVNATTACGSGFACVPLPTIVMNAGLGASSLDAGDDHTCVIGSYGMTYCWGANFYGQLGNGSWTQSTSPALVQTNASFVSVSAGGQSTCGATASYELYCWGAGFPDGIHYTAAFDRYPFWGYALANPTPVVQTVINEAAFVPVIMPIGSNYRVTVGTGFACAYYSNYTSSVSGASVDPSALVTYCWGWNDKGQTGYDPSINPFEAPALSSTGQYNLTRVSAGGHFTCADQPNGSVGCFGDDAALQLGIQLPYGTSSFRPISITGLHGVSAGDDHACALDASGYAYCWGNPQFGEIGVSANTNPKTKVSSTIMFRAIAAGGRHTCGIGTDNKIYCWGDNSDGQLGNGATSGSSMAPVIAAAP